MRRNALFWTGKLGEKQKRERIRRELNGPEAALWGDKSGLILLYGEFYRKKTLKYMKKDTTKTGLIGI